MTTKAATKKPSAAEAHRAAQIHKIAVALKSKLSNVPVRLRFLGLVVVPCGRCGGTGEYSFNPIDGSKCFGCGGFKVKLPKVINDADVTAVEEAVAAGKLQPYLDDIRIRTEARAMADSLMMVWGNSNVAAVYSAVPLGTIDRNGDLYVRNNRMCTLYQTLTERARALRSTDSAAVAVQLHADVAAAIDEIKSLDLPMTTLAAMPDVDAASIARAQARMARDDAKGWA